MMDTLMAKPNMCCAVSCIFCSEVMTLFFKHHKWIFFLSINLLVSGPMDSSALAVSCSELFHRFMMYHLGMLGSPTSQKALLKARIY